jgi:hypothetical protein
VEPVEILVARWELDELGPEEVRRLATEALEAGCDTPTLRQVAGIEGSRRAEVEELLPRFLREVRVERPTTDEAVKAVVDECARQVVRGELAPSAGARRLWLRSHHFDGNDRVWEQLRPFVGLASELEDWPDGRAQLEADIVREAAALLDRGGLKL